MATTSDGDEGESFVDQARDIDELCAAARQIDMLSPREKVALEFTRLGLLSLNRIACSLAGIELSYAAICDHFLPEPEPLPLEGDDD